MLNAKQVHVTAGVHSETGSDKGLYSGPLEQEQLQMTGEHKKRLEGVM